MSLRAKGYLFDILDTARLIQTSTEGKTLDEYQANIGLRHQVERELTIIGEALARLKALDAPLASKITGSDGYVGLRNVLNHQYPNVDHAAIWKTIQMEIPTLVRESEILLAEEA